VAKVGQVPAVAFGDRWHPRLHAPLALGEHSEPEPDVAVVAGAPFDYVTGHPTTAALVVEVADSSLRLDRRFKAAVYAQAGLREDWIVNLVDRPRLRAAAGRARCPNSCPPPPPLTLNALP